MMASFTKWDTSLSGTLWVGPMDVPLSEVSLYKKDIDKQLFSQGTLFVFENCRLIEDLIYENSDHTDIESDHEVHLIPVAPQADQGVPAGEAGIETIHRLMVKLVLVDERMGKQVGEHVDEHVSEHGEESVAKNWPSCTMKSSACGK